MEGAAALLVIGFYYFFIRPYAYRWKPCYGTKAYGVCLPSGYRVHGFDISHHQGEINCSASARHSLLHSPIRFVFLKASEGGDFSDTTFVHITSSARQYGHLFTVLIIFIIQRQMLRGRLILYPLSSSWSRSIFLLLDMRQGG